LIFLVKNPEINYTPVKSQLNTEAE
jgi:hypothetical protein